VIEGGTQSTPTSTQGATPPSPAPGSVDTKTPPALPAPTVGGAINAAPKPGASTTPRSPTSTGAANAVPGAPDTAPDPANANVVVEPNVPARGE
jgi:hypothetical protein